MGILVARDGHCRRGTPDRASRSGALSASSAASSSRASSACPSSSHPERIAITGENESRRNVLPRLSSAERAAPNVLRGKSRARMHVVTFDEVLIGVAALAGRDVHVTLHSGGAPLASFDGRLETGVRQDPEDTRGATVIAYEVGRATFALNEEQFVSAKRVGAMLDVDLANGVALSVFPWLEE